MRAVEGRRRGGGGAPRCGAERRRTEVGRRLGGEEVKSRVLQKHVYKSACF